MLKIKFEPKKIKIPEFIFFFSNYEEEENSQKTQKSYRIKISFFVAWSFIVHPLVVLSLLVLMVRYEADILSNSYQQTKLLKCVKKREIELLLNIILGLAREQE